MSARHLPTPQTGYADLVEAEIILRRAGAVRIADGLRRYFAGENLLAALDLHLAPGQHDPRTINARYQRDAALRAAATFLNVASVSAKATALATALDRYHAAGWQHDRLCTDCPPHLRTMEKFLWHALRAHDRPISARQLERILAD